MKILLFNDDALPHTQGGAAVVVDWLRKGLADAGHTVTLVTTHQDSIQERRETDEAGLVISLPIDYPERERHKKSLGDPEIKKQLVKIYEELQPDIVHAHVIHRYLTYDVLRLAKAYTDKIFLTAHDTFLASFARVKGDKFEKCELAKRGLTMYWWDHLLATGRRYNPFRNQAIRRILRETNTKVLSISHSLDRFLQANSIQNTSIVYNGLPIDEVIGERSAFRKKYHLTGPTILFASRLSEDKGYQALLHAFDVLKKDVPDAQLLIVGNDKRITKAADANIIYTGWLNRDAICHAYAAADVVTTPSLYLDAFNLTNIEAMRAGKPVVGTCFGGTPEVILDEETGYIVNPNNTAVFAKKLHQALIHSALGKAGYKRCQDRFNQKKMVDTYLHLYTRKT